METLPFTTKPLQPANWGRNPTFQSRSQTDVPKHAQQMESGPAEEPIYPSNHYEYMPAVLLNSLKRDKKPFTYTPGRLDLSEVLNAKLQKRLERKKKLLAEKVAVQSQADDGLPVFEPPKQVLVMPTYNSPINMYSMENALEALEAQAEITVAEKSLTPPQWTQTLPRNYKFEAKDFEPKNVTQSKAFKVLQIITDTDEQPEEEENKASHPKTEMTFSGTGQQRAIPSKYFHTLQKITGTDDFSEPDTQKPKVFHTNVGQLQVEDRFSGIHQSKVIPSKYFQNLQRLTGTEETDTTPATKHESRVYENNVGSYQNETRFTGTGTSKVIPSKYFQNLQRITGTQEPERTNAQMGENKAFGATNPSRSEFGYQASNTEVRGAPSFHPVQPRGFSAETSQTSIPVLQRPAAFLPAAKKDSAKKKISSTVRFSAPDVEYQHGSSTFSHEGTDF